MITDLDIEKARTRIADKLTVHNYNLSKLDPLFPKDKIAVEESALVLQPRRDDGLVEFTYAGWHCYVSQSTDRLVNMRNYLKAEKVPIQELNVSSDDGLVYLVTIEPAIKKGGV